MDSSQNNNDTGTIGPDPTTGQQAGPGPYNVVFVNYTFTYTPHPQRNSPNARDTSGESPRTGENATQAPEGPQNAQPRREGPFHGFVVYGAPPLFDNAMFNGLGGQFGLGEPPKPHASKAAIDALKDVDLKAIPEGNPTCPICFDPYYEKPAEPQVVDLRMTDVPTGEENVATSSPEKASLSTDELERIHDHDSRQPALTTEAEEDAATYTEQRQPASEENQESSPQSDASEHVPIEMPCGHIFGKNCLKEWLMSSTTCPLCRTAIEAEPQPRPDQQGRFSGGFPFILAPLFSLFRQSGLNQDHSDAQNQPTHSQTPAAASAAAPAFTTPSAPQSSPVEPSINRNPSAGSSYAVRHHPYSRPTGTSTSATSAVSSASASTEGLSSVLARPDLECGSALVGLCEESGSFVRLDCGHGYHEDCLRTSMRAHGDVEIPNLRSEADVSTSAPDQPRVRREVWCMRCRRYRDVDA
ncbi:hypothetical protein V1517DRAFT_316917 [Lipomyces orientalis]|uniref:Uncharacterized protein n=1 Tax=Lipomyces orientalis TaxID=1233043 RepID=A0ACC3TTT7_9ASCO